jgi:hypothetical protein
VEIEADDEYVHSELAEEKAGGEFAFGGAGEGIVMNVMKR